MPSEREPSSETTSQADEKQLCVSCMVPNDPEAHFCAKCGAPLSSYAATGPFERIFAEGHVCRQAAERPRKLVVVLGVWIIFGALALTGGILVAGGQESGPVLALIGSLVFIFSLVMIGKTTRSYLKGRRDNVKI